MAPVKEMEAEVEAGTLIDTCNQNTLFVCIDIIVPLKSSVVVTKVGNCMIPAGSSYETAPNKLRSPKNSKRTGCEANDFSKSSILMILYRLSSINLRQ